MSNKIYKKINISDELPNREGWYSTNTGQLFFNLSTKTFTGKQEDLDRLFFWFKDFTLPTGNEIERKADLLNTSLEYTGFIEGAEYVKDYCIMNNFG